MGDDVVSVDYFRIFNVCGVGCIFLIVGDGILLIFNFCFNKGIGIILCVVYWWV